MRLHIKGLRGLRVKPAMTGKGQHLTKGVAFDGKGQHFSLLASEPRIIFFIFTFRMGGYLIFNAPLHQDTPLNIL